MKFLFLQVGKSNHKNFIEIQKEYLEKLNYFVKFEIKELKPTKLGRSQAAEKLKEESELLLKELQKDDFVILFDEDGQSLSSTEFSLKIDKAQSSGKKRVVFIIGGAFGVSEEVKKRSQLTVSLSKMVFNHLVAQTVALEQIYRAFTIIKNIPYHNS